MTIENRGSPSVEEAEEAAKRSRGTKCASARRRSSRYAVRFVLFSRRLARIGGGASRGTELEEPKGRCRRAERKVSRDLLSAIMEEGERGQVVVPWVGEEEEGRRKERSGGRLCGGRGVSRMDGERWRGGEETYRACFSCC